MMNIRRTVSRHSVLVLTGVALLFTWKFTSTFSYGGQYFEPNEVFNDIFKRPQQNGGQVVNVKEEMKKLNEEKVAQDDARLIKIIKDH